MINRIGILLSKDSDNDKSVIYLSSSLEEAREWMKVHNEDLFPEELDSDSVSGYLLNQVQVDAEDTNFVEEGLYVKSAAPVIHEIEVVPFSSSFSELYKNKLVYLVSVEFSNKPTEEDISFLSNSIRLSNSSPYEFLIHVASSEDRALEWLNKHKELFPADLDFTFSIEVEEVGYKDFFSNKLEANSIQYFTKEVISL